MNGTNYTKDYQCFTQGEWFIENNFRNDFKALHLFVPIKTSYWEGLRIFYT